MPRTTAFTLLLLVSAGAMSAQKAETFKTAATGCAMAHCDVLMDNLVRLPAPRSARTSIFSHDTLSSGKGKGLGCSSNAEFAACSFQDPNGDNLIFFDATGARIWSSGSLLDANAYASAPLINDRGDVIAADDKHIVRLRSTGHVVWKTKIPGGIPVSPVITSDGTIVTAAYKGPLTAFDSRDGNEIGSLLIKGQSGNGYFDTINTPCVQGNRIYVSMQAENNPQNIGALIAVDVDGTNSGSPFTVAWKFVFGSPSGASPLCVGNDIYFDGASRNPGETSSPQVFGVQDNGTTATLLWNVTVPNPLPANLAVDPRGGLWAMFLNTGTMQRFNATTGAVMETLDVGALVGNSEVPYSAITMTGGQTAPVMVLGTTNSGQTSSHVIAVALQTQSLLWKAEIAPKYGVDDAPSQFPIITDAQGNSVVVAAGRSSGPYFIAAPERSK